MPIQTRSIFLLALGLTLTLVGCGPGGGGGDDDLELTDTGSSVDVDTPDADATMSCTDGGEMCGGECVDLQSNIDHCGACGNACGAGGFICSSGECQCIKSELSVCDGKCLNLNIDSQNCGECGNVCAGGERCKKGTCETLTDIEGVVEQTNEVRDMGYDCDTKGNYPPADPVEANSELHKAAQMHADRMAERGFFAHTDPYDMSDFAERIGRTDYSGRPGGENIAKGQRSPQQVVNGWAESDGHCANMLNDRFNQIGVGKAVSSQGTPYWVQVFGVK